MKSKKFDPRANLTLNQNQLLNDFIKFLQSNDELTTKERKFCDEACLCRYLRARDWNLEKSKKMLMSTLKWRREYKPEEIVPQDLTDVASTGKVYRYGKDLDGRPVVYVTPSRENSKDYLKNLKLVVYTLERAIEDMDEGVEQMNWVISFDGYTRKNAPPMSVSKETIHILSNHYPERLGHGFLVDTPLLFNLFWKVISPFIHPNTANKVHFVKGKKEKKKVLPKYFDVNLIQDRFGGDVDESTVFNTEFWNKEIEKDLIRQKKLNIVYNPNEEIEKDKQKQSTRKYGSEEDLRDIENDQLFEEVCDDLD